MLHLLRRSQRLNPAETTLKGLSDWSIRKKLLVFLIPPVILTLGVTGFVLNVFSNRYIDMALGRSTLTMTLPSAKRSMSTPFRRVSMPCAACS